MNPQQILQEEIIKMLEKDFSELQKLIDEIVKTKDNPGFDKKKLGEAHFTVQKIQMELYRLILTMWPKN